MPALLHQTRRIYGLDPLPEDIDEAMLTSAYVTLFFDFVYPCCSITPQELPDALRHIRLLGTLVVFCEGREVTPSKVGVKITFSELKKVMSQIQTKMSSLVERYEVSILAGTSKEASKTSHTLIENGGWPVRYNSMASSYQPQIDACFQEVAWVAANIARTVDKIIVRLYDSEETVDLLGT